MCRGQGSGTVKQFEEAAVTSKGGPLVSLLLPKIRYQSDNSPEILRDANSHDVSLLQDILPWAHASRAPATRRGVAGMVWVQGRMGRAGKVLECF